MSSPSLLQLARSLNAVEMLCNNKSPAKKGDRSVPQFVIVIDFEATCWEKRMQSNKAPEIIEFPAVLVDLQQRKILSEYQRYVKPMENSVLSSFCTSLTGIEQHTVDSAVPLAQCLSSFELWLTDVRITYNLILPRTDQRNPKGNVLFTTWSDWDFVTLARECKRKRIIKPSCFNRWMDAKLIYSKFYGGPPSNFADALNRRNMQFEGRQHCGLDDARNTAKLILRMHQEGAKFIITKDLNPLD